MILLVRTQLQWCKQKRTCSNNNNSSILRQQQHNQQQANLPTTMMTATILDAPILDDYLLRHVLLSKLRSIGMKLLDDSNDNSGTFLFFSWLLLYPAIHLATTLATHGQTPAARILGLERKLVNSNHNKKEQQQRLVLFSLCTTLGPVILYSLKDVLI